MLALPPGELSVRWVADGEGAAPGRPLHALYERSLGDPGDLTSTSAPGDPVIVPAGLTHAHLQVLDTERWFAERPPGLDPGLGQVHPRSRLEPLVDGLAVFALMLEDLRAATGPGCGAHFAGWAFNDFPFDLRDPDATMFTDLIRALDQGGPGDEAAGARFLMDRYINFREDAPAGDHMELAAVLLLIAGGDALVLAGLLDGLFDLDLLPRTARFVALLVVAVVGTYLAAALGAGGAALEALEEKIDGSGDLAAALNAIRPNVAMRARHPARFTDNPLSVPNPLPLDVTDYLDGVGSWHQKFQVVRRTPDALGNAVIGYVGGIDINQNRLDSPGHHGWAWRPDDEWRCPRRRRRGRSTTCTPGSPAPPRPTSRSPSSAAGRSTARCSRRPGRATAAARRRVRSARRPPMQASAAAARPSPGAGLPQRLPPGRRRWFGRLCPGHLSGEATIADAIIKAIDSSPRVHLHRGPVLHPARPLHRTPCSTPP